LCAGKLATKSALAYELGNIQLCPSILHSRFVQSSLLARAAVATSERCMNPYRSRQYDASSGLLLVCSVFVRMCAHLASPGQSVSIWSPPYRFHEFPVNDLTILAITELRHRAHADMHLCDLQKRLLSVNIYTLYLSKSGCRDGIAGCACLSYTLLQHIRNMLQCLCDLPMSREQRKPKASMPCLRSRGWNSCVEIMCSSRAKD
jgi:hypothetical protein